MPFVNGVICCKAILIFVCQIGLTSLWFLQSVATWRDIFQYYEIIVLVHSGVCIVFGVCKLVLVSAGVYFCVDKDVAVLILQMESQASHTC